MEGLEIDSLQQSLEGIYFFNPLTMQGVVKKIDDRGFGFITPSEGGKDVFFHANDLSGVEMKDLREGMTVSYEMADSAKGPKGVNVTLVSEAA